MSIRDTSAQDIPHTRTKHARLLRPALMIVATVAFLLVLFWLGRGWLAGTHSVDAARLRIAEVTRGDLLRDINADGRVIAGNSPSLYAIEAGTVRLHVVAGDAVKQGDLLAEIDSPTLHSRLQQEEATLASLEADAARAQLAAAQARAEAQRNLDQARIAQQAARRELQRYRRGYEGGAVAQVDLARAEDAVQNTDISHAHAARDAGLHSQAAALEARNRAALAQRQAALVNELKRQVQALAIRAPFDGQIGQLFVAPMQTIDANTAVLSVVDLQVFDVEIKVPESFARELAIGMPAEVRGNNQSWPAHVVAVSPEVVNGEVSARLRFEEGKQPHALRQNQRLAARILLDARRNVLKVPRGPALDQGSPRVWVVQDGIARPRSIQTGAYSLEAVEIVSGLAEGERIILSGAENFAHTERVRVKE